MTSCIICSESIHESYSIMPCCKNKLCTSCFANCIARNVGDDNGTTRNQCIFCRQEICKKVLPDTKIVTKLITHKKINSQLKKELEDVTIDLEITKKYLYNLNNEWAALTVMTIEHHHLINQWHFIATQRLNTIKRLKTALSAKSSNPHKCIKDHLGFCCCKEGSWDQV